MIGLISLIGLAAVLHAQTLRADSGASPRVAPGPQSVALYPAAQAQPAGHPPTDAACRSCHGDTNAVIVFESGEQMPVEIDLAAFDASAHGIGAATPLGCDSCHAPSSYQFPHPPVEQFDLRSYQIAQSETCVRCHDPHLTAHPGPEWSGGYPVDESESGMSVVCTDCHTSHTVTPIAAWQGAAVTAPCVACHTSAGVELVDDTQLNQHVEAGLFAQRQLNDDFCMGCHGPPDRTMTFPNGDKISISIDGDALHASVHGADNSWQELACTDCHQNTTYPHTPITATSAREYTIEQTELCARCHETQHEGQMHSVHADALAEGNLDAATCVDCHGAHDTVNPSDPRSRVSETCRQCHSTIFDEYAESVHGAALIGEDNPDVPSCIDCHGVHNIGDPTTALFRNRSPDLCATCHADATLMAKYDISIDVFETYVDDFHGTTVEIFHSNDPNVPTNKAVCFDCHGVHNIKSPSDPDAGIKENLLVTCQQCHPDATANFSDAWTGHHRPSLRDNPLMFLVNLFYLIVIPITMVFLGFLVMTDIYRKARGR